MSVEDLPEDFPTNLKFKYNKKVYDKTAKMFGQIMGTDISVEITNSGTCAIGQRRDDAKKYIIFLNPNAPYVKDEKVFYACEEHELAHPLFGSDGEGIETGAKEISDRYYDFGILPAEAQGVLSILDDQRIEANWSDIYPGSMRQFKRLREGLVTKKPMSASMILLCARSQKKELVHPYFHDFYDYCVDMLQVVEFKDFSIIFKVAEEIIKKWIAKIKDFLEEHQKQQQNCDKGQSGESDDELEHSNEVSIPGGFAGDSDKEEKEEMDSIPDECPNPTPQPSPQSSESEEETEEESQESGSGGSGTEEEIDEEEELPASSSAGESTEEDESEEEETEVPTPESYKEEDTLKEELAPELEEIDDPELEEALEELDEIFDEFTFDDSEQTDENEEARPLPITKDDVGREIKQRHINEENSFKEETDLRLGNQTDVPSILEKELDEVSTEASDKFNQQSKKIKETLSKFNPPDPTRNTGLPIDTDIDNFGRTNPVESFKKDVKRLKRIFQKMKVKDNASEELDYAGELDLDQYIQFAMGNADPDVFIQQKDVQQFNLVLVIDGSGSMYGGELETAKRIALTMKEATKTIKGINVDTWIYSGDSNKTPIVELKDHEIKTIGTGGCTHTNDAVRYVSQQNRYTYKKNVMFLLTDGMPVTSNRKYSQIIKTRDSGNLQYVQADTHFAIQEARKRGWKVFTFFIGNPYGNSGIFGRPFVTIESDNLTDVLGYFEKEVKQFLAR